MKSTGCEAYILVMNSRLPAAKSRDGCTHSHTYTNTHTVTWSDVHSDQPLIRSVVWRALADAEGPWLGWYRKFPLPALHSSEATCLPAQPREKRAPSEVYKPDSQTTLLKTNTPLALKDPYLQKRKVGVTLS